MAYPCGVCLDTTNTKAVWCRSCDSWFHADFENVFKTLFATLDKNRNISYSSTECIKGSRKNPRLNLLILMTALTKLISEIN